MRGVGEGLLWVLVLISVFGGVGIYLVIELLGWIFSHISIAWG